MARRLFPAARRPAPAVHPGPAHRRSSPDARGPGTRAAFGRDRHVGRRDHQARRLRGAPEGAGRRRPRAAPPERRRSPSLSPDKKWFVDEIGDGPVPMKTFSKPFHELGGVFVDYKANRARALTIRNNVGIQLISAADGIEEADPAAGRRPGLERDVVARQRGRRLLRPRRGRDAHLVRRRRDRQGAPADEDAGARDAGLDLRVQRGRQADRRSSRCPTAAPRCRRAGGADRADRQARRRRQEPAAHVPEPDVDATRRSCSSGTRPARSRSSTCRRARSARVGQPAMVRALDFVARREVRARDAHGRSRSPTTSRSSSFGSIEEIWDADGKVLAKVTDRADQPRRAGRHAAARSRRRRPAAAAAAQQQGKRELAWRADGQGLTYLEQEPAPAGERSGARRARRGAPAAADDQEPPARRRPRHAAAAQGPPLPVDRAVRRGQPEGHLREHHAHDRASLLARHAGPVLHRARRPEHGRDRGLPERHRRRSTRSRAIAPTTSMPIPGSIVSTRGTAAAAAAAAAVAAAADAAAAAAAAARCCCRPTASSVFFQGTTYDRNPEPGRPEDLHRQGRDQDRREDAHLRERQQQRLRARLRRSSTPMPRGSSSRAKARPRCRSTSCVDGTRGSS